VAPASFAYLPQIQGTTKEKYMERQAVGVGIMQIALGSSESGAAVA
jgi:hypothetical protein